MKTKINLPNLFFITLLTLSFLSCKTEPTPVAESIEPTVEDVIAHGEYLVEIMGCHDCHSPKRMGENGPEIIPELMLSGYPSDRPIMKFILIFQIIVGYERTAFLCKTDDIKK